MKKLVEDTKKFFGEILEFLMMFFR